MSLEMLSLGADFLGGLMGFSQQNKANRNQMRMHQQSLAQAQGQFDAQMDQSIQRRIKDAQAAGVHPLFAMGASVGASPTISAGGTAPQSTGNPMGNALSNMAASLGVIEQNRASAKKDEAEAALFDSERKRIEQELLHRGSDTATTYPYGTKRADGAIPLGPGGDPTYFSPEIPQHGRNAGVVAGTQPGTIDVRLPDGRHVNVFNPDIGLDEISQVDFVLQRARHYGTDAMMAVHNAIRKVWKSDAQLRASASIQARKAGYRSADDWLNAKWQQLRSKFK